MLPGKDSAVLEHGAVDGGWWEGLASHPCAPPFQVCWRRDARGSVRLTASSRELGGERCPRPGHHRSGLSSARLGRRPPRGPQPVASPRLLPGFGHVSPVSARPQLPAPPRCPESFNPPRAAGSLELLRSWIPSVPAGEVAAGPCPRLSPAGDTVSPATLSLQGRGWRSSSRGAGAGRTLHRPQRRRKMSLGNAGGFGTAPAPSCPWCWRPGAGEKLWSCSPRGSTASGMCGQGTNIWDVPGMAGSGIWRLPALLS